MPTWQEQLMLAAQRRARVRLRSGVVGTIVYAPGSPASQAKDHPVRHRDRSKCGVTFINRSWPIAVAPEDIIEILDEAPSDADG